MIDLLDRVSVRHAVIRRRPEYKDGDDIDVLCDDKIQLANELIYLSRHLLERGLDLQLRLDGGHVHLDYLDGGKLKLRFDLIDSLDAYKEQVYSGDVAADLALRLLEFARNPHKTQHLAYVKSHSFLKR